MNRSWRTISRVNRESAQHAIAQYRALGGTALYDALAESLIRLHHAEGRRVVVVMTDGRDENNPGTGPGSVRSFADVLGHLKESGTTVFGIGLGTKVDSRPLETTGGAVRRPGAVSFRDLAVERASSDASWKTCGGGISLATPRRIRSTTEAGVRFRFG